MSVHRPIPALVWTLRTTRWMLLVAMLAYFPVFFSAMIWKSGLAVLGVMVLLCVIMTATVVKWLAIKALLKMEDMHSAVRLAQYLPNESEASPFGDLLGRRQVITALTRLLSRLPASDVHLLNHGETESLYRCLCWHTVAEDSEMQVAILKMAQEARDTRALPYAAKLVTCVAKTDVQERVHRAARECLPVLQEQREREKVAATLLRPANAPVEAAEMLLRPAEGPGESDPQTLLRPVGTEEKGS